MMHVSPWTALSLGLGLSTVALLAVFHPLSPIKTSFNGKMGGANIPDTNRQLPQPQAPYQIKPATDSQFLALGLHEQPTVDRPLQGFCHPLWEQGRLSQGIRGVTHNDRMEYAYDYAASIGTPVYAMRAGRVISIQDKYPDWGGTKIRFIALTMCG